MSAFDLNEEVRKLAGAMANQAEAIAAGKVDGVQLRAAAARLLNNAETLKAWAALLEKSA